MAGAGRPSHALSTAAVGVTLRRDQICHENTKARKSCSPHSIGQRHAEPGDEQQDNREHGTEEQQGNACPSSGMRFCVFHPEFRPEFYSEPESAQPDY